MKLLASFLFFLQLSFVFGQSQTIEDLKTLRSNSLSASDDLIRSDLNKEFKNQLMNAISSAKVTFEELDSLPFFANLQSPDKKFRLLNWNMNNDDGSYQYFGLIYPKKELTPIILNDASERVYEPETKKFKASNWFGCLYYDIIPVKSRPEKYYVLLGWDGNSFQSTKKIAEVLTLNDGIANFGKPVFFGDSGMKNRLVFEFSNSAVMSLRYHPKKDMIIFDHLTPIYEGAEGLYEFYAPDLSFDAYELNKGEWHYVKDVDVRAPNTMKNYIKPKTN